MVLEIDRADFALKWLFLTFPTPKPMLGSKSFRSMTPPPKVGVSEGKWGFRGQNIALGGVCHLNVIVFILKDFQNNQCFENSG